MGKKRKGNIKFYISELVQVLNKQFCFCGINLPEKGYFGSKKVNITIEFCIFELV